MAGRLAAVPAALATARASLGTLPRVHVETALGQFRGTHALVEIEVADALQKEPSLRAEVEPARAAALEATDDHISWLSATLSEGGPVAADRDPRLGSELYAAKLWHALDTETPPDSVLVRAESDLMRVEAEIAELCDGRDPRAVLDELADEGVVDDSTVLGLCAQSLEETTAFVRAQDLVTVPERWDERVRIIEMPEIHRGVAVAYCDAPGPLETAELPTFFAVSPAPADWPPERVRSFYREYNAHQLRNLTVHEAMPGHVLQLAHSSEAARSARPAAEGGPTTVRAALYSGPFVEGWAVYAEELMVRAGFGGRAVALQQLKMQLRGTINAILDVDRTRSSGGRRGRGQVAPRAADQRSAVDVLRRLQRDERAGPPAVRGPAGGYGPGPPRRDARARVAAASAPAHPAGALNRRPIGRG